MTLIKKPSPNFDDRAAGKKIDILLLHYTGMISANAAIERLTNKQSKVSVHYVIDEDGAIYHLVDESKRAWHAGTSFWRGERDINSTSIGIEIVNPGHEFGYREFPPAQMQNVLHLSREIIKRHAIKPEFVLGHSDVAVGRKIDPGELFDWKFLSKNGVGIYPHTPMPVAAPDIKTVQTWLRKFGYAIDVNGVMDDQTAAVLTAFQRHYCPESMGSGADAATIAALHAVCLISGLLA